MFHISGLLPLNSPQSRQSTRASMAAESRNPGLSGSANLRFSAINVALADEYLAGYRPGKRAIDLFGKIDGTHGMADRAYLARFIDSPQMLVPLMARLKIPKAMLPAIDWKRQFYLLIAQERTAADLPALPVSLTYYSSMKSLYIGVTAEWEREPVSGTAWYIAPMPRRLIPEPDSYETPVTLTPSYTMRITDFH